MVPGDASQFFQRHRHSPETEHSHFLDKRVENLKMKITLLPVLALAVTASAGPMFSEDDIRAHLARASAPINKGEKPTCNCPHGFAARRQNNGMHEEHSL